MVEANTVVSPILKQKGIARLHFWFHHVLGIYLTHRYFQGSYEVGTPLNKP